MKNRKLILFQIASEVRGETKATLRITASSENTGKYTCVANNGIGEASESAAYLLMKTEPKVRIKFLVITQAKIASSFPLGHYILQTQPIIVNHEVYHNNIHIIATLSIAKKNWNGIFDFSII